MSDTYQATYKGLPIARNIAISSTVIRDEAQLLVNVLIMQIMNKYGVNRDDAEHAVRGAIEFDLVQRKQNKATGPLRLSTERQHRK